jgi:hypothetical protein
LENILGGLSGPKMELFYERTGNEKSRDSVPLRVAESSVQQRNISTGRRDHCKDINIMRGK